MNEFIEKLIDQLEKLKADAVNEDCPVVPNSEDCEMEYSCATCYLTAAIRIVEELAEEYKNNLSGNLTGWIPCSERLPDDFMSFEYLTIRKGHTLASITYYCVANHKWYSNRESTKDIEVIAWQPLPTYNLEEQKKIPTDHFMERFNRVV